MFHERNGISISPAKDLKTKLANGIEIYRDKNAVKSITYLVNEFPSI